MYDLLNLRGAVARYSGLISKIHGCLGLEGITEEERFNAVTEYFDRKVQEQNAEVEKQMRGKPYQDGCGHWVQKVEVGDKGDPF
jgi:hypothetical protein